jgi:hypothetical protein
LLGISTLILETNACTKKPIPSHLQYFDAPRILSTHHMPPKLSFIIDSRRLLQILATSFSPKILSKNEEEKIMGEMGDI